MIPNRSARLALFGAVAALSAASLQAQPGPWGSRWDDGMDRPLRSSPAASGEGKVEVARFVAEGEVAAALRTGAIAVVAMPEGAGGADLRQDATYQAAVESELIHAGYQAAGAEPGAQVAEVRIKRTELRPAETKRNPVSGQMTMGVSNHGSMMGLGIAIDATKPKKALLSTTLETRIRDRASGKVLWEGRAAIATRDGDEKWNDDAIARRLAHALFDGFPMRAGESSEAR